MTTANKTMNTSIKTAINTPMTSPPISPPEMAPCEPCLSTEGGEVVAFCLDELMIVVACSVVGGGAVVVVAIKMAQSDANGLSRETEHDGSRL